MNKIFIILPLFLLTMCADAPVTTPPAGALEVEQELLLKIIDHIHNPNLQTAKTDPSDAINNALTEFKYGSNDTPKSEELLQLPSD